MTPEDAIAQLGGDPQKAIEMAAYHKLDRPYLGVANPDIDAAVKGWRAEITLEERLALASGLWETNIHEGRVAAAKLLTQARIRPDDTAAWELIVSWVPSFDAWATADHVCIAGQKRLIADPSRLDTVETWVTMEDKWARRAALVMTLPWTKQNHPKPEEIAARERILGWAATYVADHDWFIQKSVAWWLRELSKHDVPRTIEFLEAHAATMKPWAVKEATSKLNN
jgi:3-methyladenine DNA glycosylase AlkD